MSHLPTCFTKVACTKDGSSVHAVLKTCWKNAIQNLAYVITRSDASTMHLGAKMFAYTQTCAPTTGRLGAYCHDWRVTHSSARCTFDRLGLGRWRWGLEEVLGRESRKQRKTKPSALCVLNRTQKSSNPAKSESSIQRRWHRKMQNVPEKEEACTETKEGCIHLLIDFQLFCLC